MGESIMAADSKPSVLYIVSDATGETAYRVTRAALTQFKDHLVDIRWRQGTRTVEQVRKSFARLPRPTP
jgi:regulator of PEP synthase PpsR (kinase-PPPase family)